MTDPATTPTTSRARELAALADYVRLLADRMGLKDWTFRVKEIPYLDDKAYSSWDVRMRSVTIGADEGFFGLTPECRRVAIVRELLRVHLPRSPQIEYPTEADMTVGLTRIAAAWAPCLPLPLVGWMRRAGDELADASEGHR